MWFDLALASQRVEEVANQACSFTLGLDDVRRTVASSDSSTTSRPSSDLSATEDWTHDASVPPAIVHLFVAVLFVWLVTIVHVDCEDLESAKYDHVRFFGLQVYNGLYLDGEAGPGLVQVLGDALVRVFRILFAVCSFFRWTVVHTSYTLTHIFTIVRPSAHFVASRVRATSLFILNVARNAVRLAVAPVLLVVRVALFLTRAVRSVYGAVRVFLRSTLFVMVAAALMALICLVPLLEFGVASASRAVWCPLKTGSSRMTTKARSTHNAARMGCSRAVRRGSLLVEDGMRFVNTVRDLVGPSPVMTLATVYLDRKSDRTALLRDYMRAPWRPFRRWSTADHRLGSKPTLMDSVDGDLVLSLSPTLSKDTLLLQGDHALSSSSSATIADCGEDASVLGHSTCDALDEALRLAYDDAEELKRNAEVIGVAVPVDVDEEEEDFHTRPLGTTADLEAENNFPVLNTISSVCDSPAENTSLEDDSAQGHDPSVKFVERIAPLDISDEDVDKLADELDVPFDLQDEFVAELPVWFEDQDHYDDDFSAHLPTSMSLGALDVVTRDGTYLLPLDLDNAFGSPPAAPSAAKPPAFAQTLRDVLIGFEQPADWQKPDGIPSMLLSIEGATSGRGQDGTVSSTPGRYELRPSPVDQVTPKPPRKRASSASSTRSSQRPPPSPGSAQIPPPASTRSARPARVAVPADAPAKNSRPRKRQKKTTAKVQGTPAGPVAVAGPSAGALVALVDEDAAFSSESGSDAEEVWYDAKSSLRGPRVPTAERRRRQKARAAAARAEVGGGGDAQVTVVG